MEKKMLKNVCRHQNISATNTQHVKNESVTAVIVWLGCGILYGYDDQHGAGEENYGPQRPNDGRHQV